MLPTSSLTLCSPASGRTSSSPELTLAGLDDSHLLCANMRLGAVANTLKNFAGVEVPECVMQPWIDVDERMEWPEASFNLLE